jgi:hypothetical protein
MLPSFLEYDVKKNRIERLQKDLEAVLNESRRLRGLATESPPDPPDQAHEKPPPDQPAAPKPGRRQS